MLHIMLTHKMMFVPLADPLYQRTQIPHSSAKAKSVAHNGYLSSNSISYFVWQSFPSENMEAIKALNWRPLKSVLVFVK